MKLVPALVSCVLLGSIAIAEEGDLRHFRVDRCLGKKCKNGRLESVTVTPEQFILLIDPDRCRGGHSSCPTSYGRFTIDGETPARVRGYTLGKKTADRFTVYVPLDRRSLYIAGIGGSDRTAVVDLTLYSVLGDSSVELQLAAEVGRPTLLLTEPKLDNDYFVTGEVAVRIAGRVVEHEGQTTVAVNGVVVAVDPDGSFDIEVALVEGRNPFTVLADLGSRRIKRVIVVERRDVAEP